MEFQSGAESRDPYETILQLGGADAVAAWEGMCGDCRGTQERVLRSIIRNAVNSDFGRDHSFSGIADHESYRLAVPVTEYSDIEGMVEDIARTGREGVLFDGATVFLTSTSGTTGRNKLIPESARGMDAKSSVVKLRNLYLNRAFSEAAASSERFRALVAGKGVSSGMGTDLAGMFHYFPLASAMRNSVSESGIEVGFASGKTFDSTAASDGLAFPRVLMGIRSAEASMYLTMLFAMAHEDVITIAGNNAGRMVSRIEYARDHAEMLIRDMRNGTIDPSVDLDPDERRSVEALAEPNPERADALQAILDEGRGSFVPARYWPYLISAGFWLSGSAGTGVERLRPLLGDGVVFFDVGYGASEAKINIPMEPGVGYGPLAIASAFYEFIPAGGGDVLTADQLEDGKDYEILLTTYSGLYRYNLHDLVRVRGFTGDTPNIEFISKTREILNIAQEKVPAPALIEKVSEYLSSNGAVVRQAQVWPDLDGLRYELFVEPESGDPVRASEGLDDFICREFPMYGRNRGFGALAPMAVHRMRGGWQDSLYSEREASGAPPSQVKLDALAKKRPDESWMC